MSVLVQDILDAIETIAPERYAFARDKIGLQVGDPRARVERAVVSLDRSLTAVEHARERGAQLLLSHHPLLYHPLERLTTHDHASRTALALARYDIAFIAAHTNWDAAVGGVNDALASQLRLTDVSPIGDARSETRTKVVVTVPREATQAVISAASGAGAGEIGAYHRCAFVAQGEGTFVAGAGANPSIGGRGAPETVAEDRIEMVCPGRLRHQVEAAIRNAHPYETPAIDFFVLPDEPTLPTGRVGTLPAPTPLRKFAAEVDDVLGTRSLTWGDPERTVQRVAVVGGAADSQWRPARASGADCLVTGEVAQHVALEAGEEGFALLCSGHYATEQPGVVALAERMKEAVPSVEWTVFEPRPGFAGRPF